MELVSGFALKNPDAFELRGYQLSAAKGALQKGNTLVVMPTALGKTFVAVLVMARLLFTERREGQKPGKYLFLTPTKPLAIQQEKRLRELLDMAGDESCVLTGEVAPEQRKELWKSKKIFCSTPQTVEHDILTRKADLSQFKLIVFDEVHHAVKDYAYSFIARQASAQSPSTLLLGLTASPSADREKVAQVCSNLNIRNIEIVTGEEEAVADYAKELEVEKVFVQMYPEQLQMSKLLREVLSETLTHLKDIGFLQSASASNADKRELLKLRAKILESLSAGNTGAYKGLSLQAKAMNLVHAIDLLESEGVKALLLFLEAMKERETKTKAVRELLADGRVFKVRELSKILLERDGLNHPKMEKLREMLANEAAAGRSAIVFAHYRHSVESILGELSKVAGVKAAAFVGRANDGMTQKKQNETLEKFRAGEYNVLVSTSIGEEGLDIPRVDLVVFYESVPSEIRLIQRRGRAGRVRAGRVLMLVTKGTKDEAFLWIARRKEKQMHENLKELSRGLSDNGGRAPKDAGNSGKQRRMDEFF